MATSSIIRRTLPVAGMLAALGFMTAWLWTRRQRHARAATRIPADPSLDATLAFLREPYEFISKRCNRLGTDCFQARLMLRNTIFMRGPAAAELFYDENRFVRQGAAPASAQKTLFGLGTVQNLDDAAHRHRKRMFMSMMTPERIDRLKALTAEQWRLAARRWETMDQIVLYDELHHILGRAVCAWAGVPMQEEHHIQDLRALFDYAGAANLKHYESRTARRRLEHWLTDLVTEIRSGRFTPPDESPASVIAWHRDLSGELLTPRLAAAELLNVLRPVVAVSTFVVHSAHALHLYPEHRRTLLENPDDVELFVQEVRRFYPFFPAVVARVRQDFEWNGFRFPKGTRVVLDLYGTNHDPETWESPETFNPARFRHWDQSPFNFIPQGGGDHDTGHRCPGEWITIALMKQAVELLVREIEYEVPRQDLRLDRSRLPAMPRSFFVIRNVRAGKTAEILQD